MVKLYDKHGIPFERGDVVKTFHFIGARRKRHYIYHQCLGVTRELPSGTKMMAFSHLNFIEDPRERDGPFEKAVDGKRMMECEIVQSIKCDHEERERKSAGSSALEGET